VLSSIPVRQLFGIPVRAATMEATLALIEESIARRSRLRIGMVNAAKIVNMRRDRTLREDVVTSDLVLADGMSVVWAARLLGQPLPARVAGIDLMMAVLERGDRLGWRVYCVGATPEVLEAAVAEIARRFPGVVVAGHRHGYFEQHEEPRLAAEIAASGADILLVAMTSPKKERFLGLWGDRLAVPVCHGVGGSFDVLAGKVKRAPVLWQRLGLEWLYRVMQEPGRLWKRYLVTNALFCELVLAELVRGLPARWRRS
jgi:N-acetylglucosaminyldiphosphoundecaprenol N-acetyl-beta-D-mannosaminyltransferase